EDDPARSAHQLPSLQACHGSVEDLLGVLGIPHVLDGERDEVDAMSDEWSEAPDRAHSDAGHLLLGLLVLLSPSDVLELCPVLIIKSHSANAPIPRNAWAHGQ